MTPKQVAQLVHEWMRGSNAPRTAEKISDLVVFFGRSYGFTQAQEAEALGYLAERYPQVHELTKV